MLPKFTGRLLGALDESAWIRLTSRLTFALPIVGLMLALYWLVPRFSAKDEASVSGTDRDRIDAFIKEVGNSVAEENARLRASAHPTESPAKSDNKNAETKERF